MVASVKLQQKDRPKEIYLFLVQGRRRFPIHLLFQSQAWPARPQDASRIAMEGSAPIRSVLLCSYCKPDHTAWAAFNWSMAARVEFDRAIIQVRDG